jgi:TPP-dependent 2-oxoacid decarboxylase
MATTSRDQVTVGEFVAIYLQHLGIEDYFTVPGDFNLLLLDEMLKNKNLRLINCCNELNAGYAADGYPLIMHPIYTICIYYTPSHDYIFTH